MAHAMVPKAYRHLVARLNRSPMGAPPSDLLNVIVKMLYSEKDAEYASLLPIKPFELKKAARIWRLPQKETRRILDNLAGRGLLLDIEINGRPLYLMPPPMAGFFEFSLMRIRKDLDQKKLSELLYQYLNVEEDFIKSLFTEGTTRLGRILVNEKVIPENHGVHVLDYERSGHIIRTASHISVSLCYCRHKMRHMHRACDAPMSICMTLNQTGASLIKHGIGRKVDAAEALDLLQQAHEHNLVQFGENVREQVNFICHCCGCCCEALSAAKRFGYAKPVHTTRFLPQMDVEKCVGCGKCAAVCPVQVIAMVSTDNENRKQKQARVNEELCLGCGVCVRNCGENALRLRERKQRIITSLNSAHNVAVMAIERGKLQNFIFDSHALRHHRIMAAILGVILKLPPVKQVLAGQQVKSRYLEYLISKTGMTEKSC